MSKKKLYFDSYCGYITSAVTENGKLTEFNFEKKGDGGIIGNLYKGRVENVLPGMRAAFIDCGLERNCYLSDEDAFPDIERYETNGQPAPSGEFKEGDEIIVQIVKAPVGKKGARVTAHPRIVGKCLIYLPELPITGVSRRIADAELKRNLVYTAEKLKEREEGLIVRTVAPYASRTQLETEYRYLKNMYIEIEKKFASAEVGELLYAEAALPVRVLRDTLSSDIESVTVGNGELGKIVADIMGLYPMRSRKPVTVHDTGRDLMNEVGIARQIFAALSPRVELDNGAYLIIEKTEALTVIDVNTGSFTGDYNHEQTVYYTNQLAAREIARQVKLRNIGGIIVVDFIDMQNPAHRRALTDELKRSLKNDSAKCTVLPMSDFGLIEFTRKRTGSGNISNIARPCVHCGGTGNTVSAEFVIFGIRAQILNMLADGAKDIRVDLSHEVFDKLTKWREATENICKLGNGAHIYAVPRRSFRFDQTAFSDSAEDLPKNAVELT